MRTDLVRWCKDLGSLPEGVYEALCSAAWAARSRAGGRKKMLLANHSEIVQVEVGGEIYYADVFGMGWTLLKPKEATSVCL